MKTLLKRERSGVTAVEFAFIAPFVFLTMMVGIEFIRANVIRHTAGNAAYAASRAVIVPGADKAEAVAKAQEILALVGVSDAEITFTPSLIAEDTAFVSTNVVIPMNSNGWGISSLLKDAQITVNAKLRTERAPVVQALSLPTVLNPPPPPPPPPTPPTPPPIGPPSPPEVPPTPPSPPTPPVGPPPPPPVLL